MRPLARLLALRGPESWIIPGALLACPYPRGDRRLRALVDLGITTVINLHTRPHPAGLEDRLGLREVHLPVPDFSPPSPGQIRAGVAEIRAALGRGERVAVHCGAGLGRTGTLVACYLVSTGLGPSEAIAEVRRRRPGSIETLDQIVAVRTYVGLPDISSGVVTNGTSVA